MTSFGESLRREREIRGVTLQEIAAGTKIGVRMLSAIEQDELHKLPQGLFVRGFVREYARFLGLDEQKILTELSFHAPAPVLPQFVSVESSRRDTSRTAAHLTNAGLAAAVFGLVTVLILSPGFSGHSTAPAPAPPVQTADVAAPVNQAPINQGGVVMTRAESPDTQSLAVPAAALPAGPPSVLPQPLQLTLTATEDCWIGLDVGGDRVENRVLKKGESFSITARQNASLAVGNAGGLLVAIDSGPARPLGNRGEVKRNIPLSPEALGALSAVAQSPPPRPIG